VGDSVRSSGPQRRAWWPGGLRSALRALTRGPGRTGRRRRRGHVPPPRDVLDRRRVARPAAPLGHASKADRNPPATKPSLPAPKHRAESPRSGPVSFFDRPYWTAIRPMPVWPPGPARPGTGRQADHRRRPGEGDARGRPVPGLSTSDHKPITDTWLVYLGPTTSVETALDLCVSSKTQSVHATSPAPLRACALTSAPVWASRACRCESAVGRRLRRSSRAWCLPAGSRPGGDLHEPSLTTAWSSDSRWRPRPPALRGRNAQRAAHPKPLRRALASGRGSDPVSDDGLVGDPSTSGPSSTRAAAATRRP